MKYISLSEIATYQQGKQISIDLQYDSPSVGLGRFVRIVDYTNKSEPPRYIKDVDTKYHVNEEDLVMIRYGSQTAGSVVRGISGIIANNLFQIKLKSNAFDKSFMYYYLSSSNVKKQLMGGQGSSTMPAITFGMMKNIMIPVFDLADQKRIAGLLDLLSEKIRINKEVNENLTKQMLAIYTNARESSAWPVQRLETVLSFYDHMRKPLSSRQRDGMQRNYPYYGAASIVDYVEDYIFDGTYILISEDGANVVDASGHPLIQYTYGKFWVNNHAHIVQGAEGFSCALIFALMKTVNIQSIVTGAAQPKVNQANLKNFATELPAKAEAKALSAILDPLFSKLIENDKENVSLSELRDVLLPKLMSGELDVSELDL